MDGSAMSPRWGYDCRDVSILAFQKLDNGEETVWMFPPYILTYKHDSLRPTGF